MLVARSQESILREDVSFFANCLVSWQSKKRTSVSNSTAEVVYIAAAYCTAQILCIASVVSGQQLTVTPTRINVALTLNDTKAPTTVSLKLLHNAFIQCDYQGDLKNRTLYKAFFYPKYKLLYHTILQCLSQKSTSWGEMPYDMQYVMYAVLSNKKVNLSQIIFDHLVHHQKSPKFLLYPRFVMACLFADLNKTCHIAPLTTIKGIDKHVFTRLNTDAKQTDDTKETPILGEPASTSSCTPVQVPTKRKPSTKASKPKMPKKTVQEDEIPEHVSAPTGQLDTSVPSSQMHQESPPHLAPHQSSQQDDVVLQREPSLTTEMSLDIQIAVHSPKDISISSPHTSLNSPTHFLHEIDYVFEQLASPPTSPIEE
ncbi:hypothetical protein E3N88_14010 [Mikania micrantha]|uniref:Uncharacterized protein n=1 Tax=Mikania micrantha TaxID=192012 RepID=A0A5N6P061_9ASTR|nr:hypothetical protein E3N88_14010 [Mikania micrantha]